MINTIKAQGLRRANINDIAKLVGVNAATVSRVLSGKAEPKYGPAIKRAERIRQAALQLGYRPNTAARATVSGRFYAVSLLLSNQRTRSNLPVPLLKGISEELENHKLRLDLACLSDRVLTDDTYMPTVLSQRCSDALLINYHAAIPPHMIEIIERGHLPVIWLNVDRPYDAVRPDDFGAAKGLTRRLLEGGRRRVAYLDLAYEISEILGHQHYSKRAREQGYLAAMKAAGQEPWCIHDMGIEGQLDSETVVTRLFDGHQPLPEAIVCYSPLDAAVVEKIAALNGKRVPADLELVTFRGTYRGPQCLRVTAAVLPEEAMGRHAVRMLLQKMESPSVPIRTKTLRCAFEEGATTRKL